MALEINEKDKLQRKIMELEERLMGIGDEEMTEVGEKFSDYMRAMKERGKEFYSKAKEKGKMVDEYAREHPWLWMGLGILVGSSVGMIAAKSMHRKHCCQ